MQIRICKAKVSFLFIILLSSSLELYAQFNQQIFKKSLHLNHFVHNAIQPLGDQNKDGFDDFLVFDCNENKSYIFFGGNPVDTVPKFTINFYHPPEAIIDLNNDGIKDLVFFAWSDHKVMIFWGGKTIDTIPDLVFNLPPGASGGSASVLKDFNGDGRSELVFYDQYLPYSNKQFGTLYFYNTGSVFDTIPHYVMYGDSVNSVSIFLSSSGDINGDGKTDFAITGAYRKQNDYYISFYLGNSEFNLTPAITYKQSEHLFDVNLMAITPDLNKDGHDDIIIKDYGFYPYYYHNAILKGSFPIDTIPDFGLNTQNIGIYPWVIPLGDVNGDGFNDFIAETNGEPNDLKLWVGGRKIHAVADKTWYATDPEGFGQIYGAVGDVNGDGLDDIAIASVYIGTHDCDKATLYIFNGDSSVHADTITSIKENNNLAPTGFKLNNPYPNPFNPTTTIKYQLNIPGKVTLKVYDIMGSEVACLVNEYKDAGYYSVIFNGAKLASGVYIYRLQSNNFIANKKMIILK